MLKIGVGPSSSHTLGPWRAAQQWIHKLKGQQLFKKLDRIQVDLYGSLSLTGKGHATDLAILSLSSRDKSPPVLIATTAFSGSIFGKNSTPVPNTPKNTYTEIKITKPDNINVLGLFKTLSNKS